MLHGGREAPCWHCSARCSTRAVFFVFFGLSTDPAALPSALVPAAALAAAGVVTKLFTGWVAGRRTRAGPAGRRRAGAALVARGEFSIIIAGLVGASVTQPPPSGRERLRTLFDNDVRAVTRARFDSFELPRSFGELEQSLETALARIGNQSISEKLECDRNPLWTILVTGPKPAGTNVDDGLTVLYVDDQFSPAGLRSSLKVWFGLRPGYMDLVRLYVPYRGGRTDTFAVLASYVREHEAPFDGQPRTSSSTSGRRIRLSHSTSSPA